MSQIKPYKIKRRKFQYTKGSARIYDPKDGVDVNRLKWGFSISPNRNQMSMHDSPNLYERTRQGNHRSLGIMKLIGKTNRYKSLNLNGQVGLLNRKAYNVR